MNPIQRFHVDGGYIHRCFQKKCTGHELAHESGEVVKAFEIAFWIRLDRPVLPLGGIEEDIVLFVFQETGVSFLVCFQPDDAQDKLLYP